MNDTRSTSSLTRARTEGHRGATGTALTIVLCAVLTGCSENNATSSPAASQNPAAAHAWTKTLHHASPGGYLASDGDSDVDDDGDMRAALEPSVHDTFLPQNSGAEASRTDRRAITTLIKSYYAAAAAGDGTRACPMLYSTTLETLAEGRGTSAQSRDRACATTASTFFRQQHQILATDNVTTMVVVTVHIKGRIATALVGFKTAPIGMLRLQRDRNDWKLLSLLDTGLGT